jgi:ATP-binding cassette, subfamily B, heavy metal transporter
MWNRQREAEEARETLARAGEDDAAPNRVPPPVEEGGETDVRDIVAADAAE